MSNETVTLSGSRVGVVMSEEQLAIVLPALRSLYSVFCSRGGDALPAFEACGEEKQQQILSRTFNAIEGTAKYNRDKVTDVAKVGVATIIAAKRSAENTKWEKVAKLDPELRALMGDKGAPPNHILVSLSEVSGCFPKGTSEPNMVKMLHTMGYALAKGVKGEQGVRLSIPLKVATPATATPGIGK